MPNPMSPMQVLMALLRTKRPAHGSGCQEFTHGLQERGFSPLAGSRLGKGDTVPILTLQVGQAPQSAFFAHLDTVHHEDGGQTVVNHAGILSVKGGGILGADDAAGIYVLLSMIEAQVPGLYVITPDEEVGAPSMRRAVKDGLFDAYPLSRAISFDRRGSLDIITDQAYGQCASDEFGNALADALAMGHKLTHGVYTDSVELNETVPEIVNISCGYANEHGPKEALDLRALEAITRAAIKVDWNSLPTVGVDPGFEHPGFYMDYAPTSPIEDLVDDYYAQSFSTKKFITELLQEAYDRGFDAGYTASEKDWNS